ncbi:MAG TPA: hypothetical protein PLX33_11495 [Alphaproteobacteria bacterium]|nr:hypothetical protein [Alphaproteobacteria bacterium]
MASLPMTLTAPPISVLAEKKVEPAHKPAPARPRLDDSATPIPGAMAITAMLRIAASGFLPPPPIGTARIFRTEPSFSLTQCHISRGT